MTVDMVSYLQSIAIPTSGARPLVGQYLAFFAQETVQREEIGDQSRRFREQARMHSKCGSGLAREDVMRNTAKTSEKNYKLPFTLAATSPGTQAVHTCG